MNKVTEVEIFPVIDENRTHLLQITGPRGGLRAYQKPGSNDPLWSVTTIIDRAVAKPALLHWYNKQGREAVAEKLTPSIGKELTAEMLKQALGAAAERPRKTKDEAADLGTRAHNMLSAYIMSRIEQTEEVITVPPDLQTVWESFHEWEENAGISQYLKTEFSVYSESWKYAGSVDALAWSESGKYLVLDWKTSKSGPYPEQAMQVSAYAHALSYPLSYMEGVPTSDWNPWERIEPWVIRLGKDVAEFEAKQVTNPQMALDGFLHAMEMWYSLGLPGLTDKAKEELAEHFELPDKLPSVW